MSAPGVDPVAIELWLSERAQVAGPLTLHRIGLGQSNLTYRVVDESGRAWVLRRPPLGHLLESAHDVAREARILSALGASAVPVPGVLGTLAPGAVGDDVPAFVMAWVEGVVVDRMVVAEGLPEPRRRSIGTSLARTLAEIHGVDISAVGLADLASHKPYAPRQLRRWSAQWAQSRTRDLPALDRLTQRLESAVPAHEELSLVHGDFHVRNVITDSTGDVVSVLDWELSTLGEPLADLGTLLAYWPEPGEEGLDEFVPSTLPGFPSRGELVHEYGAASGRDLDALGFWHALGLWKLAIIAEGVLRRALDEPRNRAAEGTPEPEKIAGLVDRAHAVADEAGL
jgi:aminoglycoside phosphotransferase (APT) family kinase protein